MKARRQFASHHHLGGAMLRPSPTLDLHLAMNQIADRIHSAKETEDDLVWRLVGRRIETGDDFRRDQRLAIGGGCYLRAALDDLVLVAADVTATLIGDATAENDPVVADRTAHHGGAQSSDKSR